MIYLFSLLGQSEDFFEYLVLHFIVLKFVSFVLPFFFSPEHQSLCFP